MQGLNAEAAQAVRISNSSFGHYFASRFHHIELSRESVDGFKSEVTRAQYLMAELDKHVTYTKKSFCETVDAFLKAGHSKLESLRQNAVALVNESSADPALRFLQAIKTTYEINRLSKQVHSMSQETDGFLQPGREIGSLLSRDDKRIPPPSPEMFNIVLCPRDGIKLRLPENSGDLIATCPKCKYSFAYNTGALSFLERSTPKKHSWWQRFLRKRKKRLKN